ncbi:hypothetical protein BDA96_02G082200 [Sorghum bicolor]|uniref:O-methyltransferase domain-containing protein n=1 Tax=Sorghum bicolor TaxID=4558 RepID=A0A921RLY5_SORBI|nr:hypothetical protein BDA96_02G082200 [Sorghum bicolor]
MTSTAELLQAEAELWCHAFGYLKSMALQCAIKLGIPNAIHRSGGTASLPELHAALPVAASKRSCVSRIMTFLAASGIFSEESPAAAADGEVAAGVRYSLTPASRLLVDDDDSVTSGSHHTCLSQFMLLCCSPINFRASQSLDDWLRVDELDGDNHAAAAAAETPFMMANGASLYGLTSRDAEFGARFSEGMGSDSRFVAEILARGGCAPVFAGLTSLVDVGGGDGTTARAIARAYPHVRCSVLELPEVVVDAVPADGGAVEFVAGDMMEYIPPADAVLLKFVLHNWSDEECVRILKLSKEAISTREPKGKVIIIDVVLGSSASKQILEAQLLLDLCMMVILPGKQRDEEKWHKIFLDAGFTRYKMSPMLGSRSLIEVYP